MSNLDQSLKRKESFQKAFSKASGLNLTDEMRPSNLKCNTLARSRCRH